MERLARFKCNEPRALARSRSAAATVKNAVTLPSNAGQVKQLVTDVWSSTKNQSTSSAPLNLSGAGLEVEGKHYGIFTAFLTAAAASSSCRHPPSPHPPSSGSLHLEHVGKESFSASDCWRYEKNEASMIQMQRTRAPPRVQPPPVTSRSRVVTPPDPTTSPSRVPTRTRYTADPDQIRSVPGPACRRPRRSCHPRRRRTYRRRCCVRTC